MPYFHAMGTVGNANFNSNQTMVFGGQNLDQGGGYNQSNGIYTCPIKGLYYFHMSLYNNGQATFAFSKNGASQNTQIYDGADAAPLFFANQASFQFGISIIVEMNANDTMRVKARSGQAPTQTYMGHSTFFGMCLAAK
jgi:hypothetical protein